METKHTRQYAEYLAGEYCKGIDVTDYTFDDFTNGYIKAIEETAAPELLEALIEAKELIKREGYGDDHLVLQKINNSIKKATE